MINSVILLTILFGNTTSYRLFSFPLKSSSNNLGSLDDFNVMKSEERNLQMKPLMLQLANNATFWSQNWQRYPLIITNKHHSIENSYSMLEVRKTIDRNFLEAGMGSFREGKGGWNLVSVSQPRGTSYEDAKLCFEDVLCALQKENGTVVVNSAGGYIPELAQICFETVNTLKLPAAVNLYLTNHGQSTSAPVHTDKQDVFVLQTSGSKHWRVFSPPPPSRMPFADPYARGKGKDLLTLHELSQPLMDVELQSGQLLYVPAGFPHATDTITSPTGDHNTSVHLTIGIDTLIWGLTYAGLRNIALRRSNIKDKLSVLTKIPPDAYWQLQQALPLGFLSPNASNAANNVPTSANASISSAQDNSQEMLCRAITAGLISRMRAAEPARWGKYNNSNSNNDTRKEIYATVPLEDDCDAEMAAMLCLSEVVPRIIRHHADVTRIFERMYDDVANEITPVKMNLSIFRSQPYFQELETTMQALYDWADAGSVDRQFLSDLNSTFGRLCQSLFGAVHKY